MRILNDNFPKIKINSMDFTAYGILFEAQSILQISCQIFNEGWDKMKSGKNIWSFEVKLWKNLPTEEVLRDRYCRGVERSWKYCKYFLYETVAFWTNFKWGDYSRIQIESAVYIAE